MQNSNLHVVQVGHQGRWEHKPETGPTCPTLDLSLTQALGKPLDKPPAIEDLQHQGNYLCHNKWHHGISTCTIWLVMPSSPLCFPSYSSPMLCVGCHTTGSADDMLRFAFVIRNTICFDCCLGGNGGIQCTVGVSVRCDFDLRDTTECGRDAGWLQLADKVVVISSSTFTPVNQNECMGIVIGVH
jgi:hypothetical protein